MKNSILRKLSKPIYYPLEEAQQEPSEYVKPLEYLENLEDLGDLEDPHLRQNSKNSKIKHTVKKQKKTEPITIPKRSSNALRDFSRELREQLEDIPAETVDYDFEKSNSQFDDEEFWSVISSLNWCDRTSKVMLAPAVVQIIDTLDPPKRDKFLSKLLDFSTNICAKLIGEGYMSHAMFNDAHTRLALSSHIVGLGKEAYHNISENPYCVEYMIGVTEKKSEFQDLLGMVSSIVGNQ